MRASDPVGPRDGPRFASRLEMIRLETPPVARVVPDGVFDAFEWSRSSALGWWRPRAFDAESRIRPDLPERLLFLFRETVDWLPSELACLHAPSFGFSDERILAPYAIDDATDLLYERRVEPKTVFELATDNLNALFYALHDWVHFHNHGPFEERAWTEYQCDLTALVWIFQNQAAIGLNRDRLARLVDEVDGVVRGRFVAEGLAPRGFAPDDVFRLATSPTFL